METPPRYEKLTDSKLWKHLASRRGGTAVTQLIANVRTVAEEAAQLAADIGTYMPLYTLHNERHLLNIVGWMERLLGANLKKLSSLEAALAILAAYTHDLGMTLTREEHRDLLDENSLSDRRTAYLRHRAGFLEEARLIDQLRLQGEDSRADVLEAHIVTDYLRKTHASDEPRTRLAARLDALAMDNASLYRYDNFSFRDVLHDIGRSHNEPVNWLRGRHRPTTVRNGEPANFPYIGLLLRLADIMDLDATRTPRILFHHVGLDGDLATRFQNASAEEWRKHMAIDGVGWPNRGKLTYHAHSCPHPAIEKSIRDFAGWIETEIDGAARELELIGRPPLNLPKSVELEIEPEKPNGKAVYTYHDWTFNLDQEEIIRLLMGEALYGDPSLCIRELLQNALDAVELRDLRHQLRAKGGVPALQPDGIALEPGYFTLTGGDRHELHVELTWGEKDGHKFIRVTDNGTGMTRDTIGRFFTRIGRSFYQSPDFRREQQEMRRYGLICSAISQFGIGVLSCFMVASRISVRTHPGAAADGGPADLEISGPGSLFWTRPGTLDAQGTEITLWLRPKLKGHEVVFAHDWDTCRHQLLKHFDYWHRHPLGTHAEGHLDPGLIAARHVVWPRHPVQVVPPGGNPWTIDHRFHLDRLIPIDKSRVGREGNRWGVSADLIRHVRWATFDWEDLDAAQGTGTRVRLWLPENDQSPGKAPLEDAPPTRSAPLWQIAALLGSEAGSGEGAHTTTLIHSMFIRNRDLLLKELAITNAWGCRVWIDFRGSAACRLTASREACIEPDELHEWRRTLDGVWRRFECDVKRRAQTGATTARNLLLFHWRRREPIRRSVQPRNTWALKALDFNVAVRAFAYRDRRRVYEITREGALNLACSVDADLRDAIEGGIKDAIEDNKPYTGESVFDEAIERTFGNVDVTIEELDIPADPDPARGRLAASEVFQHAFFPDLAVSWPPLDLFALDGKVGDAVLTAPGAFRFDRRGSVVRFGDPAGKEPQQLIAFGYHLCFPMTSIPLGRLRCDVPDWRASPSLRSSAMLAILFAEVPEILVPVCQRLRQRFREFGPIFAFAPERELWSKPFDTWSRADWNHSHNRSYLIDFATNKVTVAEGAVSVDDMRKYGHPYKTLSRRR
ncbi:MAG: ATP-binding protein [Bryobacteraceae bacterium]